MTTRRQLFTQAGTAALGAALASHSLAQAATAPAANLEPFGSGQLKTLSDALAKVTYRRDFKDLADDLERLRRLGCRGLEASAEL